MLRTPLEPVTAVAISPDGKQLFTGGNDGSVERWSLDAPQKAGEEMYRFPGSVATLAVSQDGRWLVQYDGNRLKQWSLDVQQLEQEACEVVGRNLSQLEWDMYFPADNYHATCNLFSKELDDSPIARR